MNKRKIIPILILFLILAGKDVLAQTSPFSGIWQLMRPPVKEGVDVMVYPVLLRSFDEKGNYTEIAVINNGAFIQARANFKQINEDTVSEEIKFAVNTIKIGKTYTFNYKFIKADSAQYLITEGGKKVIDGKETVEWREVWRKVDDYK